MFGPHVSRYHAGKGRRRANIAEHIDAARTEAEDEGGFRMRAAAIFVSETHRRRIIVDDAEAAELKEYIAKRKVTVIAHSSYVAVPWRGDPDAARHIRAEAAVCQAAGIAGLVVHLPKLPLEATMRYIARLYNPKAPDVRIYLETPAVSPKETYYETPAKLAKLFAAIRAKLDPDLLVFGLCIDTAHIWTCGVDIASRAAAATWIAALEAAAAVIPPAAIMFHLNDSARARGVGPDSHAALLKGRIWEKYADRPDESGLAAFVEYITAHDCAAILERAPKEAILGDYIALKSLGVLPADSGGAAAAAAAAAAVAKK
jgi:endonuclease IV